MRKTQNHFNQLLYGLLGLILIGITFGSCEAENELITNSRKYTNGITFEQFKNETGFYNFKTSIDVYPNTDKSTLRLANGEYEMSDFDVSTDIIKKLESAAITSYTFRVYPKEQIEAEEKSIFNLSLFKKGDVWETMIIEFRPTPLNYEQIKEGLTEKVEGDAKIRYQGDFVNNAYIFNTETMRCATVNFEAFHCEGCTGGVCDYFSPTGCKETNPRHKCGPRIISFAGVCTFGPTGGGTGNSGGDGNPGGGGSGGTPGSGPATVVPYTPIDWYAIAGGDGQTSTQPEPENPMIANVRDVDDDFELSPTHEYFTEEKKVELENYLEENELALLDIPCNQIEKWQALSQYNLPISTVNKISNLQDQNSTAIPTWNIQFLAGAEGATVNMDFFPVTISHFPNNPLTNQPYTPQQFYTFFRKNLNTFLEGTNVSFAPSTITGQNESEIWNSTNPIDAVISINMNPDSGSVICSNYSNNHWFFTTLTTPWAPDFGDDDNDGMHPVSGNREFGYYLDTYGNYVFYVRGVDRIERGAAASIASIIYQGQPFQGADSLWNKMKENLVTFVNNNGGTANSNSNEIYRPDWNKVKEVLRGNRPKTDLGCN